MGKPISNGLVELIDEGKGSDRTWFCMDIMLFMNDEKDKSWEHQHQIFMDAKNGNCKYRDKCSRYKRTVRMEQHKLEQKTKGGN